MRDREDQLTPRKWNANKKIDMIKKCIEVLRKKISRGLKQHNTGYMKEEEEQKEFGRETQQQKTVIVTCNLSFVQCT